MQFDNDLNQRFDNIIMLIYENRGEIAVFLIIALVSIGILSVLKDVFFFLLDWIAATFSRKVHRILVHIVSLPVVALGLWGLSHDASVPKVGAASVITIGLSFEIFFRVAWWWNDHAMTWWKLPAHLFGLWQHTRPTGSKGASSPEQ